MPLKEQVTSLVNPITLPFLAVQSKSKTIKKTPKKSQESSTFQQEEALSHSPNPSSDDSSRVYDTFSSVEREKILENVKEEALKHLSLGDQANWHQEAAGFKPKVYKGILAKVIPKFVRFLCLSLKY